MNDIEEVKTRTEIVDVVQSYVRLKKSGRNLFGLCPFHTEKTPSFSVNLERQIYKCFGCGKGGDAISFIQEVEHLSFREALQLLADRVGVKLTPPAGQRPEDRDTKTLLYRTLELATQLFHTVLTRHPSGAAGLEYLHERGLTDATIETFRLGWVPRQLDINPVLGKHGIPPPAIRQAGGLDRFKERIVFPLYDQLGNVVAFTGRILGAGQPKYLNSPDSPLYAKHRTLYGLHLAKGAIRTKGYAIVVEGQMDVVASYQAGFTHTIASSGTALTEEHTRILKRLCDELRLAFDADEAGARALQGAAALALQAGFIVKTITIPTGKDAADTIKDNPQAWGKAVEAAPFFMDHLLEETFVKAGERLGVQEKRLITKTLLPWIAALSDPIEREHYIELLSRRLGASSAVVREALRKQTPAPSEPTATAPLSARPLTLEEQLIGLLVAHPALIPKAVNEVDWDLFTERLPQTVFKTLQKSYTHMQDDLTTALSKNLESAEASQVLSWGFNHDFKEEEALEELRSYLGRMRSERSEQIKRDFAAQIEAAERSGDRASVKQLVEKLAHALKSR